MALTPENLLKKLRKLDTNCECPNCGTIAPQGIGFGSVCVKFKTFVCDLCKTSHQAISHRVKSITMSNWTMEEVLELTSKYNGGNDAARHIWLKNAPSYGARYPGGVRPRTGERIEVYKQFVVDCYEHGKFKSSDAYVPSNIDDFSAETSSKKASIKPPAKPSTAAAYRPARPAPAVVPQTTSTNSLVGQSSEGSLIDFFSDAAVAGTPTSTAGSTLSTFDPFGDSSYTPSPTPMNGQPLSQNQSFDSSTSAAYKTSATASSAFDPFGDDFGDFNSAANKPSISDELLSSFNQGLFLSDPNSIVNSGSNTSSVVASQNSATTSAASVFDFMPTAVLTPVSSSSSLSSSSPVVPQGPPQQGYNPSGMGANSYGGQPSSMLSSQMARGMGVGIMGGPQYTYHQQNQTRNGYNAAYGGMGNGMYPQAGVANGSGMRPMGVQPVGVNGYKNSSMSISQLPMPGQEHTVLTNNQAGGSKGSFNFVQDTIKSQLNNNRR